jgi:hypothetical protein
MCNQCEMRPLVKVWAYKPGLKHHFVWANTFGKSNSGKSMWIKPVGETFADTREHWEPVIEYPLITGNGERKSCM